jgi:hypothetical protein
MSRGLGNVERQILEALQRMPVGYETTSRYLSALIDGVIDELDWEEIPKVPTGRMRGCVQETRHYKPSHARLVAVQRALRRLIHKGLITVKLVKYRNGQFIGRWYTIRLSA